MRRLSASIFSPLLIAAFILNPLAGTLAVGADRTPLTFTELVRNTKETDSILLRSEDLAEGENYYPADNAKIQGALADAFAAVAASMVPKPDALPTEACEPLLLSRFQTEVAARGLPADPTALRFAVLLLRQKNLIDDITLMPMLAAYPAWAAVGYSEKDWVRKDPQGRTAIVGCPTDQFLGIVGATRTAKGRKMKRKDITRKIDVAATEKNDRGEPRYLPVQITWLRALEDNGYDQNTSFALNGILQQVADAKDSSPRADPKDRPTKVMSKRKKKSGGLSNRLALYAKYNSLQINMLSDEFKKFTERMDLLSAQAEIVIKYKDGRPDEVYPLSQQEQYRMAAKMLHKDVEELKLSGIFLGRAPTFDDVIVAAVENGFLHASELDAAMGVDEVWNPKVSGWTKVVNIVKKYGATALVLIPNPFSFWASLAITLAETLITKKVQGPGEPEDQGISIF